MIIETRDDIVCLSGTIGKNEWLTIKAAVILLLHEHPGGIIVDCSGVAQITESGARTFLEAMRDAEALQSRMVVANLPENVLKVIRSVPGVRSQLPVANSIQEARASLHIIDAVAVGPRSSAGLILVPLVQALDLSHGAFFAARLVKESRTEIRLVYFMEVARNLPLGAPLAEAEAAARQALSAAAAAVRQQTQHVTQHVERVREPADGILGYISTAGVETAVIAAAERPPDGEVRDFYHELVTTLMDRAACEVIIARARLK